MTDKDKKAAPAAADKPRRRIVLPNRTEPTVVSHSVESLKDDALSIVSAELAQYRAKTKRGVMLSQKEARVVQGYLDTLVKISKEAREAARAHDLSELSNEELLQLATQLAQPKKLTADDED